VNRCLAPSPTRPSAALQASCRKWTASELRAVFPAAELGRTGLRPHSLSSPYLATRLSFRISSGNVCPVVISMKFIAVLVVALLASAICTRCYAASCNCEDWIKKEGYCVDYIKDRIPIFPIPYKEDMPELKNTDVDNVTEGDVAIFTIKNFWHVAYVERVHRDLGGEPVAIDVSEKNFGDQLTFKEFKAIWKSRSRSEWRRALCCGITDNYDRVTRRSNIDLATVKQIWSPDDVPSENTARSHIDAMVGKVREVINRFFKNTEGEL
jgi:hypothetical protein